MSWVNSSFSGEGPCARGSHACAVVGEDKLVLFGGQTAASILSNPRRSKSFRAPLRKTPSGLDLSFGEASNEKDEPEETVYLDDLWIFDNTQPADKKWLKVEAKGEIPCKRAQHSMIGLPERNIVVLFGGYDGVRYYNDVYMLDVTMWVWKKINATGKDMPKSRGGHAAAVFTGSLGTTMVLFGGKNDSAYFNDMFILDLKDWKWYLALTSGDSPQPRAFASANSIGTQLYVFGGENTDKSNNWCAFDDLYTINTVSMRWTRLEVKSTLKPSPRYAHTATLFGNGKSLLVFGGSSDKIGTLCDPTVFVYDTAEAIWVDCIVKSATSGDEPPPRTMHSGHLIYNSKIFLFGGQKTECFARDDGYVMQNVYTNTTFIFYHLELLESKSEIRHKIKKTKAQQLGNFISTTFLKHSSAEHNGTPKKEKKSKKSRNSKKHAEEEKKEMHVGAPFNAQRLRHVTLNLEWTGNPEEIFTMEEKLGQGSFGAVYKARDKQSGYVMAIKEIEIKQRTDELKNEIDILKKFNHNNVVKYFGLLNLGTKIWILMEYCALGSIRDMIETLESPLTEPEIAFVTMYTIRGLAVLHAKNIIHRDVKAANILLTEEGQVKIADFGVSDTLEKGKPNQSIGTPLWMAPEVIRKMDYDSRCDIWSLGITIIEMADGFPPHHKEKPLRAMMMVPMKPPPTVADPKKWSKDFNDFVEKCLIKDPKTRPQALDLIQHPFIQNVGPTPVLQERIGRCLATKAARQPSEFNTGTFDNKSAKTEPSTPNETKPNGNEEKEKRKTWRESLKENLPQMIFKTSEKKDEGKTESKEEDNESAWNTQVTKEVEQPDVPASGEDIFSTQRIKDDVPEQPATPPPKPTTPVPTPTKPTTPAPTPPKTAVAVSDVPLKRSGSKEITKAPAPVKQVTTWGTSVIHDIEDDKSENDDIYSTSVVKDGKEESDDAYSTSVVNSTPAITPSKNSKEEDIFSTSVVHNDESPTPPRKSSMKKRASITPSERSGTSNSSAPPSPVLPPAEMQKVMEATMKAIHESEAKLLKEMERTKNEIMNHIHESSNKITIIVEGKGDKIHEANEKLREHITKHLQEADQGTLLKIVALLKKST